MVKTTSLTEAIINSLANNDSSILYNNQSRDLVLYNGSIGFTPGSVYNLEIANINGECLILKNTTSNTSTVDFYITSTGKLNIITNGSDKIVNISNHNTTTSGLALNNILITASATELNILDGILSTTNELNVLSGITANTTELNVLDGITANTNELNVLDGITANTTKLNYVDTIPGTAQANKAIILDSNKDISGIHNLEAENLTVNGTLVTATATEINYIDTTPGIAQAAKSLVVDVNLDITNIHNIELTNNLTLTNHNGTTGLILGSTLVTATAIELNILDGVTATTAELNILDGVTATTAELNILDGVTATTAELNILDGVTATTAELNFLDITTIGLAQANKALILDSSNNISGINSLSATSLTGTLVTAAQTNITSVGTLTTLTTSGIVSHTNNTTSTSTTSGALVITGGVGIGGATYIGGVLNVTGNITGTLATASQINITSVGTLTSLTTSGVVSHSNNTASTNTTSGALVVTGGVGIGGAVYIGGTLNVRSTSVSSAINILSLLDANLPTSGERYISIGKSWTSYNASFLTFINVADNSTSNRLGIGIYGANSILNVVGTNRVGINNTSPSYTLDITGNAYISTTLLIAGTTASSSTTSGALVITGGVGIGGNTYIGGSLYVGGSQITAGGGDPNGYLTGITPGTGAASKALILDSSLNITNINNLTTNGRLILNYIGSGTGLPSISCYGGLFCGYGNQTNINQTDASRIAYGSIYTGAYRFGDNGIMNFQISNTLSLYAHTSFIAPQLYNGPTSNTVTTATTCYISGAPSNAGYVTITNPYALYIASGNTYMGGTLNVTGGITGTLSTSSQTNITSVGTLTSLTTSGQLYTSSTTASTSTTTGALRVGGGAGIAGSMYLGGSLNVSGDISTSSYIYGTINTAGQPYITSLGTLSSLSSSGNINCSANVIASRIMAGDSSDYNSQRVFTGLQSGLATGSSVYITVGKSASQNNQAEISYFHAGAASTLNRLEFGFYGIGAQVIIRADGKMGIGVTSPSYQLQVANDSAGKPGTQTWAIVSDLRIKDNIINADLDLCYNNIKNLRLARYTWKDDVYTVEQVADRSKLGWIAQEVELIFPKAVTQIEAHGYTDCRTLNSDQIYAAMYGAIQKLILKVETQENIINSQNVIIDNLTNTINNILSRLNTLENP